LISERDLEVLDFVARFGLVPRSAVEVWAHTKRSVTLARERRLREAGLLEVCSGVWGESRILVCTKTGLKAVGRGDLRPARFSLASVGHESVVAEIAATFERRGEQLLSEREMLAAERAEGARLFSAELPGGRAHRADLVRSMGVGPPEAIEVELVAKAAARLDELLRAWRRAVAERRLSRVVYRCRPRVKDVVARAVERTRTAGTIEVEEL